MKVITEETIRQLLRKQQLHRGEALEVSEKFKVKQYKVPLQIELPLQPQAFNFKLCSWRLWQCSVMSLRRQLEYVESLLKPYDTISQSFADWISQIEGILNNS